MKILFWSSEFWPSIGGVQTQTFLFVKKMHERNHSCLVLTQKGHPNEKDEEIHEGIRIKRFDFQSILFNRGATFSSIKDYIEWVLKYFQPNVVQLNACIGESAVMFSMLQNLFSIPLVLTIHSPHYGIKTPPIAKKVCSRVDRICCVSKWIMKETLELFPEFKDKLRLIYNGLPLFKIAPMPLSFTPPVLLLMGRLAPEKGFATAIKAFSLLKKRESPAKLLIAGEGVERNRLSDLVRDLELDAQVEFTGALKGEEIPHTINRATLMLIPSHFESFGLAALEAMQMGRPVIASNVGGLPEIISNTEIGSLVPHANPEALCKAIENLINQPEKAVEMGARAREMAMENFTIDQNALQYEQLYQELTQ